MHMVVTACAASVIGCCWIDGLGMQCATTGALHSKAISPATLNGYRQKITMNVMHSRLECKGDAAMSAQLACQHPSWLTRWHHSGKLGDQGSYLDDEQ